MKKPIKIVLAALGVNTLVSLWVINPLINSSHSAILHWQGRPSELFLNTLIIFCLPWIIFIALFTIAERPGRPRVVIWFATVLLLPWIVIKNIAIITGRFPSFPIRAFSLLAPVAATFLLTIVWKPSYRARFERALKLATTLLIFLGISGLLALAELAWFAHKARDLNTPAPLHAHSGTNSKPRIVWIIFDELSYQQLFVSRPPSLDLPAFDRFASESTNYTQVVPAGPLTEVVVPSLLTGQPVEAINAASDGRSITLHHPNGSRSTLDPHDTIFQDALNAGYSTAVVGWFIPYCRVLPAVLDHCTWTFNGLTPNGFIPNTWVTNNIADSLLYVAGSGPVSRVAAHLPFTKPVGDIDLAPHISDYETLLAATLTTLKDPTADFVLIHLPVPHPGGIYDRRTRTFATRHTSYADNLALADQALAQIRATLEASGQWDSTTILIMGDHSWRTPRWQPSTFWTAEDERNHPPVFDPRPAYLLKRPNQHTAQSIDTPVNAADTRTLLRSLLIH